MEFILAFTACCLEVGFLGYSVAYRLTQTSVDMNSISVFNVMQKILTKWNLNWSMCLTLILLTWTIWRAPTNASKWRMGFNSAFKGLIKKHALKTYG